MKKFKLSSEELVKLIEPMGGAIATDKIVVEGCKIGYMYRANPVDKLDSGWCFFEGTESDSYLADASKRGVYDVNTIANYDPAIIPYLHLPIGVELERVPDSNVFNIVSG